MANAPTSQQDDTAATSAPSLCGPKAPCCTAKHAVVSSERVCCQSRNVASNHPQVAAQFIHERLMRSYVALWGGPERDGRYDAVPQRPAAMSNTKLLAEPSSSIEKTT